MLTIEAADPAAQGPRALLEASHALMAASFRPEDNHYLSVEELAGPDVHFFAAREGAQTLGTGALAVKGSYGEVKSMFTAPEARCKGVAAAILRQIEDTARDLGLTALKLETGQGLHAAHTLYERAGFTPCVPFGDYTESPSSVFFEKAL